MKKQDPPSSALWLEYVEDVLNGSTLAGEYVIKAVETFVDDLARGDGFRWKFHPEKAEKAINFIQKFIVHTRGEWAGKPFLLSPWQQFFIANLFGWYDGELRRYRTAYLFVGRKSGKTQLAAAIVIVSMVLDSDGAGEYVFAATKRDQARLGFDEVRRALLASPILRRRFEARRHDIRGPRDSVCKPLSSDSNTMDGLSVSLGIVDELHGMRDGSILRVIKSSQGSRRNGLTLAITTAGFNIDGPAAAIMKTAKAVLDGVKSDERTFALMYQIDDGDDWKDPTNWVKSNPGLGESISLEYLNHQSKQAQNAGGRAVVEFMTKHLNIFVSSSSQWIDRDNWRANFSEDEPEPGALCYAGLDLGSVSDLTALALIFPRENDFLLRVHFFVPERAITRKLEDDESTIYAKLADLENVHVTPGNVTDYDFVRKFITGHHTNDEGRVLVDSECLATNYNLKGLAFDRYNSSQLITDLTNDGIECAPFGMGFVSQSAPTKEAERLILDGKLKHNGDPVLEWQLGAVALTYDPAGNVKITKNKSGKVDGLVALIMALGEFMTWNSADTTPELPEDFVIRTI